MKEPTKEMTNEDIYEDWVKTVMGRNDIHIDVIILIKQAKAVGIYQGYESGLAEGKQNILAEVIYTKGVADGSKQGYEKGRLEGIQIFINELKYCNFDDKIVKQLQDTAKKAIDKLLI